MALSDSSQLSEGIISGDDDTENTAEASAIAKLPTRAERLKALAESGLIRNWETGEEEDGLAIWHGKVFPRDRHDHTTNFPFYLLKLPKDDALRPEVNEVLLGQNRILLEHQLKKALVFLRTFGESVKHIRRLDVKFYEEDLFYFWENGGKKIWVKLAKFIATNLDLENLELSLDAGETWEQYKEMFMKKESLGYLVEVYQDVVDILKKALKGRKPKSLFVYWALFFEMEAKGEKEIMGADYDSEKLGKIPHTRRSPFYPHGAPEERLEFPDGFTI